MKGNHLRHDKTCLNCGFPVEERFCSRCGQENTEPVESFAHLVGHFLQDVTHYDSKFFISLKDLVLKPGFLTKEYNEGKRVKYLNPIRMYVFISAIFFLILFASKRDEKVSPANTHTESTTRVNGKDTTREQNIVVDAAGADIHIRVSGHPYQRVSEYDSIQGALPKSARDGAISRYMAHKVIHLQDEHPGEEQIVVTQSISHDIPKIMFVLLPLFAFYVSLLYRRHKHYYSQFAIFSLHFHSFVFMLFLVDIGCVLLNFSLRSELIVAGITELTMFVYLTAALARAYQELWWISVLKAIAIGCMYWLTLIIGLAIAGALTFIFA